jgi:hypothetical protein
MAVLYDDASSEYSHAGSWTAVTSAPVTIAAWFKTDTVAISQWIGGLSDTANNNDFMLIGLVSANLTVIAGDAGGNNSSTKSGATANTWMHAAGVFASTTSRTAYLDGVAGTAETTLRTPASIDTFAIAAHKDNIPDTFFSGLIAEVGVWNAALDAAEINALAKGFSPKLIRPSALVAYYPHMNNASYVDMWKNKLDLTAVNTPAPSSTDHPRMIK